jgi:hypothetical protein
MMISKDGEKRKVAACLLSDVTPTTLAAKHQTIVVPRASPNHQIII